MSQNLCFLVVFATQQYKNNICILCLVSRLVFISCVCIVYTTCIFVCGWFINCSSVLVNTDDASVIFFLLICSISQKYKTFMLY